MSAIGGKADMAFCAAHVRFWGKADMPNTSRCRLMSFRISGLIFPLLLTMLDIGVSVSIVLYSWVVSKIHSRTPSVPYGVLI